MNLLYLSSHSILEYDQFKLWTDLGYSVFSIGAYTNPQEPGDDKRPAIDAPYYPDLAALCHAQRVKHDGESTEWAIDWAKADLHPDLIEWADAIIVDCFPETWIGGNWPRIRHKRVIWRTIGQSGQQTERFMRAYRAHGLQVVRYSPAEKRAFGQHDWFAGEDAMIRFAKDPEDWFGWTGEAEVVGNVTQNMAGRGDFCNLGFWLEATKGLAAKPAGPGSENLPGGIGALTYDEMRQYLRTIRAYLYTGTQPASYTLGLMEAMMTGVPVVSIGPERMWTPELFEANDLADLLATDDPETANYQLRRLLNDSALAGNVGAWGQDRAIELFGIETVGPQWLAFLGSPVVAEAVPA